MIADRNKRLVRFLHLPKCGGQTFNGVLAREYSRSVIFSFSGNIEVDLKNYRNQKEDAQKEILLFRGHAPIETGIPEADNAVTLTILREPVSRVKSFCQHVSEGKSPHLLKRFSQSTFNLETFLSSGLDEISNLQTKMLINRGSCGDNSVISNFGIEQAVALAFKNLTQRVYLFGLQEQYDESLVYFAQNMNWSLPYYARRNVKSKHKRLVFSDQHIKKIIMLNKADLALYSLAKKEFAENLRGASLQKDLRRIRFLNKYIVPFVDRLRLYHLLQKFQF